MSLPTPDRHEVGEVVFAFVVHTPNRTTKRWEELSKAQGTCRVQPLSEEDAPVVMHLNGRGGTIAVRRFGGILLRPVLAPGSWATMDLPTFRGVACSGGPWRDDPFAEPDDRAGMVLGVDERAVEPTRDIPQGRRLREAAESTAKDRAGSLFLVDGVVHRTCPDPVLAIAHRVEAWTRRDECLIGWALGELRSWTDQSVQTSKGVTVREHAKIRELGLPPVDVDDHAALMRHLDDVEPGELAHGVTHLDPDVPRTDLATRLSDVCDGLRSVGDVDGPFAPSSLMRIATGLVQPTSEDDAEPSVVEAIGLGLAERIRDELHDHDAVSSLRF